MSFWRRLDRLVASPPYEQREPIIGERRIVGVGVVLSALLLAFGLTRVVVMLEPSHEITPQASSIFRGLRSLQGDAALLAGLLVLALTPVLRLVWILCYFERRKDRWMAAVTAAVLVLIGIGIALGSRARG